jgi:hypothetical protein
VTNTGVGACVERPPELFEGVRGAALDRTVGHDPALDLGVPLEVGGYDRAADDSAVRLGGQLRGRRGERTQVAADGLHQRPRRVRFDAPAVRRDLRPDEVDLVVGSSEPLALDFVSACLSQGVEQALRLGPAGMHKHQVNIPRWLRGVRQQRIAGGVAHVLDPFHHQNPPSSEQ